MSKKLLLADDSITIQKVIGITFAHEDYQLSVVDNGDAALQKAREIQPDLILADVLMPGMNGYDLCETLKQDPQLKNTPVLLLAGTFEPFDEAKARQVGADSWIAKPFSSQALIDQVEQLLEQAAQQQDLQKDIGIDEVAEIVEPPSVESDLWAEVEEPAAEAEISFADISMDIEPAAELQVDEAWGEVSFAEEDLQADAAAPLEEGGWDSIDEEPVASPLDLDSDVLVESSEESVEPVAEDELLPLEEDELLVSEVAAVEPVEDVVVEEEPVEELLELQDEDILELDEEDILLVEDEAVDVAEAAPLEEEELLLTEDMSVAPQVEAIVPVKPSATVIPLEAVEAKAGALSEDQLEAIVEKVVGRVVEKLAESLVEKVVWEVVPDLAESMIKEEIRKIKQGAGSF